MKIVDFKVDKKKVKKCMKEVSDYSRKGIVKANIEGTLGCELNIEELNYLYDHYHQTRSDLIPEMFPDLNGKIDIEKSKEFWGEYWPILFGENGERWGMDLGGLRDVKGLYD